MKLAMSFLIICLPGLAAQQTWTGQISDNMCGADHSAMTSGPKKVDPGDCTLMCVKDGGRFVLVSKGQVFGIANQNFGDLTKHSGHAVKVTGNLESDGKTITVSKVEMNR